MRFYQILFATLAAFVAACNNPGEKIAETGTASSDTVAGTPVISAAPDSTFSGCFSSTSGKDTVTLQLDNKAGLLTGPLSYNYFEKDRNDGNFQGAIEGDIIAGWYLFKSEGTMSVRQVAWKVKGDQLWQGTGEMIERSDTAAFKNIDALQYDSLHPLKKIPCRL